MKALEIAGILAALEEVLGAIPGLVDDKHIKTLRKLQGILKIAHMIKQGK